MMFSEEAMKAANALRVLARNEQIKEYVQQSDDIYPLLLKAAKRFVAGETKEEGISKARELISKGYSISLEYIGENTRDVKECIALIKDLGHLHIEATISLDLSHIGLSVDPELALDHIQQVAKEAQKYGHTVMISMEESTKTDQILDIYKKTTTEYPHVGITIQAHLHRSLDDVRDLMNYPGKIRLVKGAYQEAEQLAIPRSDTLNERYLQLLTTLIEGNHPLSIATHDEVMIQEVVQRGFLNLAHVECEMLYGIRPDLIRSLKEQGFQTRVYLTYGSEWYLYLCHRLAEFPPNVYTLITDIMNPAESKSNLY